MSPSTVEPTCSTSLHAARMAELNGPFEVMRPMPGMFSRPVSPRMMVWFSAVPSRATSR